ncbi:MAG TPA: hypothetical protein VK012_05500 [Gemmatimonadales bacterium]|nr:hypothetical protein [Gemmatimonadales bacterium]
MTGTVLRVLGVALLAAWIHGVWAYIQMVRNRRPGTSALSVSWAPDRLTEAGLRYRSRVLWSWAAVIVLLVVALLFGR